MTLADEILEFTFSGDPADPIKRHLTGLYSFDHAFETAKGELGMPIGTGYEIFGAKSVGKSTFCYSLAGMLAVVLESDIALSDLEGFDSSHLANILNHVKFTGDIHLIHQGTDEKILERLEDALIEGGYSVGMLDSIAAISPAAEKSSELGAANMGRRAFLMAQFSRRLLPIVHPRKIGSEHVFFLTNHWYGSLEHRGYQSPGGNVKDYLCGVQIHLKRKSISWKGQSKKSFPDGSYRLQGTLYKNRYGIDGKMFTVFVKAGVGIHKGLTAMFDALDLKLASRGKTIRIGDESVGTLRHFLVDEWQNDEIYQPFYDILKEHQEEVDEYD